MTPLTMWRPELIHPFAVHLPIAFLVFAALCAPLRIFFRDSSALESITKFLVAFGTLGVWVAVWSGELGHSVVNRVICDPTVTHRHEDWSWWAAYLASAALVCVIAETRARPALRRLFFFAGTLFIVAGGVIIPYAAHLGATLVYQQAAAVYRPTDDCREFSE